MSKRSIRIIVVDGNSFKMLLRTESRTYEVTTNKTVMETEKVRGNDDVQTKSYRKQRSSEGEKSIPCHGEWFLLWGFTEK